MVVYLYLAGQLVFTAVFLALMVGAARARRPIPAAVFGALGLSNPVSYVLSLLWSGEAATAVGLAIILAMVAVTFWFARRAYRTGPVVGRVGDRPGPGSS